MKRFGPLVTTAIGDSYGACFEACDPEISQAGNDLAGYKANPHFKGSKSDKGLYTDDTQMAVGLADFMLSTADLKGPGSVPAVLAGHFVHAYKRDPRAGYMPGFRNLLKSCADGTDFLKRILPHSEKSGAAMRAGICGLLPEWKGVVDLAMWQASLTHATHAGMVSAAVSALMVWHCRMGNSVADIPHSLDEIFPGFDLDVPWTGKVPNFGIPVVRAALTALVSGKSQAGILKAAVDFGGDTDTVAAVAMCAAAMYPDIAADLPDALVDGFEKGPFGMDFLDKLDRKLCAKFGVPFPGEEVPEEESSVLDFFA